MKNFLLAMFCAAVLAALAVVKPASAEDAIPLRIVTFNAEQLNAAQNPNMAMVEASPLARTIRDIVVPFPGPVVDVINIVRY